MGWSVAAAEKRTIADALSMRETTTEVPAFKTVVVDVNATFRATLGKWTTHLTPMKAATIYVSKYRTLYPDATFIWCFDDPSLVPEERKTFYKIRYPMATRPPKKTEVIWRGQLFKASETPVDDDFEVTATFMKDSATGTTLWSRAFGNPAVKHKIWKALALCLFELDDGIIDGPDGEKIRSDTDIGNWGEADAKAMHWALTTDNATCIDTIDWDMFIQVLLLGNDNISVRIGTIWKDDEKEYYSLRSKTAGAMKFHEFLRCPMYSRPHRLHIAFWCLCHGGVDYCTSIKNRKLTLRKLLHFDDSEKFIREGFTDGVRVLSIDAPFESEALEGIIYCLLYYLSWNPDRRPAGPLLDEVGNLNIETHRNSTFSLTTKLSTLCQTTKRLSK